jgi:hypothetical protein
MLEKCTNMKECIFKWTEGLMGSTIPEIIRGVFQNRFFSTAYYPTEEQAVEAAKAIIGDHLAMTGES